MVLGFFLAGMQWKDRRQLKYRAQTANQEIPFKYKTFSLCKGESLEQAALGHCGVPVFRGTQNLMGPSPEQLAVVDAASAEVLNSMDNLQRSLPTSSMPCVQYRWQIGPSYFGSGTANKQEGHNSLFC